MQPTTLLLRVIERLFPMEAAQLPALLALVEEAGRPLSLPPEVIVKLLLVVEELFLNTVHHGGTTTDAGPVRLRLQRGPDGVELRYEDVAVAYDPFAHVDEQVHALPLQQRPVGRLGVMLVQGFARQTRYQRLNGRNCICIELDCPAVHPGAVAGIE